MSNNDFDEYGMEQEQEISLPVTPSIMLLFGEINDRQAAHIVSWIITNNLLETPPQELKLLINSQGGSASAAFAIIEAMRGSAIPISTIGMGQICSAGLLIFMNGSKGKRLLTPTCSIMSHQFSTAVGGTYHELINVKKELDFTHKRMLDCYMVCTGKSESYVLKFLLNPHDAWLSPTEAIKHKIADRITNTTTSILI